MIQAWQWAYRWRDPISYAVAVLMVYWALHVRAPLVVHADTKPPTEMNAVVEFEQPVVPPPPQPPQPQPQPVVQTSDKLPQTVPLEPTAPPPAAAANPLPASAPETPPAVVQKTSAAPPTPVVSAAPPPVVQPPVTPAPNGVYEAQLLAQLERIKRYPTSREARQTHPQGVVRVWLLIARDGRLLDSGIAQSSGSNLLDGEALRTLRAATYPPFPEASFAGEASHRFSAGLKYEIEGN